MGGVKKVALIGSVALLAIVFVSYGATASGSSDPHRDRQWSLDVIDAPAAWEMTTGRGTTIAIVDTGVHLDHPDLTDKVVTHPGADVVDRSLCGKGPDTPCFHDGPVDRNGHGTHVAGIAAASAGNGVGIAGVAPGAKILPVRVLDAAGSGTARDVALGIEFAANHHADVINLSLGISSGTDKALRVTGRLERIYEAIDYALNSGAIVVVAAGNDTFPFCAEPSAHPRVLCVGATDRHDVRSWYSNADATLSSKFIVAPGGRGVDCGADVYSTYLRWPTPACGDSTGYESMSGTSMAAPHVSGVAALLLASGANPAEATRCILRAADDLGVPGRDSVYGYGRLDARRAAEDCSG